jgi:hypothetical protein
LIAYKKNEEQEMRMYQARRARVAVGITVVGVVLAVASVAYACVPQRGDLVVTAPGQNSNLITGDGSGDSLQWCSGREPTLQAQAGAGDEITVDVDPATACTSSTNQLKEGINEIWVHHPADGAFTYDPTAGHWKVKVGEGCFYQGSTQGVQQGEMTVTNGSGLESFNLNLAGQEEGVSDPGEAAALCIGDPKNAPDTVGIFSPLEVTSL